MSNPAVIELSNTRLSNNSFVRIEDNIGESIHIHIQNYRFDFSINDFFNFSNLVDEALNDLLRETGFLSSEFDPLFLEDISNELCHLEEVTLDYALMSSLLVSKPKWWGVTLVPVSHSTYLSQEYIESSASEPGFGVLPSLFNPANRLTAIRESLSDYGYPYRDQHLVLFNNESVIRDGQHRAVCLHAAEEVTEYVLVKRLWFKNGRYGNQNIFKRLVIFSSLSSILKRIYRKVRSKFQLLSFK